METPSSRPAERRTGLDDGAGHRQAGGLRALRAELPATGSATLSNSRQPQRVARRSGRRAACGRRHRPPGVRRVRADRGHRGAQARQRSTSWPTTTSRSPTCRPATPSSCRSRWPGPRPSGPRDIFIGVNALDYSGYPDCRPEYIAAFEAMANLATKAGVEGSQLDDPHAADRADQGRDHRTRAATWASTTASRQSCYDPDDAGRPCGHCDSCLLRLKGFAEAGLDAIR